MFHEDEEPEIQEMIGKLLESGAMKVYGMMDNGEVTYTMVPEVLKVVMPELYDIFMEEVDEAILALVEAGLVSVEYDENLTPWFNITDEGRQKIVDLGL